MIKINKVLNAGFLLLILISFVQADDVYFLDGGIYQNVIVSDTVDRNLQMIESGKRKQAVSLELVKHVVKKDINSQKKSKYLAVSRETKKAITQINPFTKYVFKNFPEKEHADLSMFPVIYGDKLGYIDSDGKKLFETKVPLNIADTKIRFNKSDIVYVLDTDYDMHQTGGVSRVKNKRKLFTNIFTPVFDCFNADGEMKYSIKCNWMGTYQDGYAQVQYARKFLMFTIGHHFGFVDENGDIAIEPQFEYAAPFSEGFSRVRMNKKFGFIDKNGQWIIDADFSAATDFNEGYALVKTGKEAFFLDKKGNLTAIPGFQNIWQIKNGLARIIKDGKFGFINSAGETVIEPKFALCGDFSEDRALVRMDGKFGFIDKSGSLVIDARFDKSGDFSNGLAAVLFENKWGFINREGEFIIPNKFKYVRSFSEGLAMVWEDDYPSYINTKGEIISSLRIE